MRIKKLDGSPEILTSGDQTLINTLNFLKLHNKTPKVLAKVAGNNKHEEFIILEEDPKITVREILGLEPVPISEKCPYQITSQKAIKIINNEITDNNNASLQLYKAKRAWKKERDKEKKFDKRIVQINGNSVSTDHRDNYDTSLVDKYKNDSRIVITPSAAFAKGFARLNFKQEKNRNQYNSMVVETEMLLDTGCMISTISTDFYNKLNDNSTEKRFMNSNIEIKNCSNESKPVKGMTTIRVYFTKNVHIDLDVLITDQLTCDFILGYDFLGCDLVKEITKKHFTIKQGNDTSKIPIVRKEYAPLASHALTSTVINAYESAWIAFELRNLNHIRNEKQRFTLKNCKINNLQYLPTAFEYDTNKSNTFIVPVQNMSANDIIIDRYTKLSGIELIDENSQIYENNVVNINTFEICEITKSEDYVSISSLVTDGKETLNKQKAFDEKEKEESFKNLDTKGFFQHSVTDFIKDKSAITEMSLVDDKKLSKEEFLEQFNFDNLNTKHLNMARRMILKNDKAFATHKYDIGKTDLIEMNINVSNKSPKMQKYIPIPLNAKEQVREILDQLKKYDIIRECNEPSNYCSNILVIKKRDGKSIRLLFDGRLLNYDTDRLPMATVSKPEILSHLVGKKHLTSLDFADAFFHIPLDEKSQPLTAFYSQVHGQRFCFTRAPQGLRNSPLYLKLLLDKIFADMADSCILFFDDLLIATDGSLDDHIKLVDKVLQRIIKAGLKLRPQKLNLAKEHIEFLGMIFTKGTINIPEAKLMAFRNLPSPNTPKKAKSLICALSYYRNFVPNFAKLSKDIMDLSTLHPKQFKWTKDHEVKLRTLIDEVCKSSKLYLPNPKKRFFVQTDSSDYCGGGRVYQLDDDGNERLIAAVSRTYSKTERSYSIFKKEILALLYTLKTMDYFLRFADKLTILVDAKSIVYLRLAKDSSGILLRFSLELSKYNADIFHVSGEQNIVSDVLSRQHSGIDDIINEAQKQTPLTEKESIHIIKKLTLPRGFTITREELENLLEGQSPSKSVKTSNKKSKAPPGERKIKNTPTTLTNKKLNLPKLSMRRPGVILEKKNYNNSNSRKRTLKNNVSQIVVENNAVTRSMAKNLNGTKEQSTTDEVKTNETTKTKREGMQESQNIPKNQENSEIPSTSKTNLSNKKQRLTFGTITRDYITNTQIKETKAADNKSDTLENKVHFDANKPPEEGNDANMPPEQIALVTNDTTQQETLEEYLAKSDDENEENGQEMSQEISYRDAQNLTHFIQDGLITTKQFIAAQQEDNYCLNILTSLAESKETLSSKGFEIIQGILFRTHRNIKKPVLPKSLIEPIINIKHFSIHGAHSSPTRILRDIQTDFYIQRKIIFGILKRVTKECYLCQIYDNNIKDHIVKSLPKPSKPRDSWSIDIISNMPKTAQDNSQILLCVDDFTSYVICIPIKDSTSKSIIYGLTNHIIQPFGIPSVIRSDQQASFYNSSEFYEFTKNYNIQLHATGVASPFSNSRAESQIKQIKLLARKFLFQEHCIDKWDEFIPILTATHNSSCGIYGYSAEQLMFGTRMQNNKSILKFDWINGDEQYFVNKIFEVTENKRNEALSKMKEKTKQNKTYKNLNRETKSFELGSLVLHKQLQVSTGKGSDYKPKLTGPFVITKLNKDDSTAICEHMKNGSTIKAHFTNLHKFNFTPKRLPLQKDFLDKMKIATDPEQIDKNKPKPNKRKTD